MRLHYLFIVPSLTQGENEVRGDEEYENML